MLCGPSFITQKSNQGGVSNQMKSSYKHSYIKSILNREQICQIEINRKLLFFFWWGGFLNFFTEQVPHLAAYHIFGNGELQYVYGEHKNQPSSAVQRHIPHSYCE